MNICYDRHPLGNRFLQYTVILSVLLLTVIASSYYKGTQSLILLFGVLTALVVKNILSNRHSFFVFFLLSFLTLGCWGKLVLHLLLKTQLIEPTGTFNGSGESWDSALIALNIAFATLLVCSVVLARLPQQRKKPLPPINSPLLLPLLYLSMIFTVAILVFNYKYSILKIGTPPTLQLNAYVYGVVSFMIAWGNVILLATLGYWLVSSGKLKPQALFYIISFEGALAAVSMGSRAQMILHAAIPFVVYLTQGKRLGWSLSPMQWLRVIVAALALFVASILLVSADRINSFYQAKLATPVVTEIAQPPVTETAAPAIQAPVVQAPAVSAPAPQVSEAPPVVDPNESSLRWQRMFRELGKLIVDRWVGLEGVLTVVSTEGKGAELFSKALVEKPSAGTQAIYQRMADAQYPEYENFVFMTIPGPMAVLLYSDSYLTLVAGLALIFAACFLLELSASHLLDNVFTRAAVGVALAYLVVQTNFPRVLLFMFLEALLFIGGLLVLRKLLTTRAAGLTSQATS